MRGGGSSRVSGSGRGGSSIMRRCRKCPIGTEIAGVEGIVARYASTLV